jgi:hypothetical protein
MRLIFCIFLFFLTCFYFSTDCNYIQAYWL